MAPRSRAEGESTPQRESARGGTRLHGETAGEARRATRRAAASPADPGPVRTNWRYQVEKLGAGVHRGPFSFTRRAMESQGVHEQTTRNCREHWRKAVHTHVLCSTGSD